MNKVSPRTNVAVVDAAPIVRLGVRRYLEQQESISVEAEFDGLEGALEHLLELRPDIVIADIEPGELAQFEPLFSSEQTRVIVYSSHSGWDFVDCAIKRGCSGFVSKYSPVEELMTAIGAALENRQWISPYVRRITENHHSNRTAATTDLLSPREIEIVVLVARGMSSKQIADQLCVGVKTVESHRYRVYRKLGFANRSQLVNWAIGHGLV